MAMADNNEDDPSFRALSARLRHRIDRAFDSAVSSAAQPRQSRSDVPAGGFVVEAGGFIVEDHPSNPSGARAHIPLSEIPRALNLLDLSPDEDIMGVFRNATTGWGAQNARSVGVSRKDWRAVCAALLEGDAEGSTRENSGADENVDMGTDSGPDSDEYQTEGLSGSTEGASSDEYDESSRTAVRARKVSRRTPTESSGAGISRQLTDSQKAQCLEDFGRFFPHVPDNELDHQRIMIKDIARVADLFKENLETEEILEMLEAFSTSPDKSMNLADFEHMMVSTKLV